MPGNPLHMVRECKGAALSILVILFFVRQSVGKEFLQRWSGYTDKSIWVSSITRPPMLLPASNTSLPSTSSPM
jgi:hypothetical protein